MSKRVLIVEDEKNIVDILSFNLTRAGISITASSFSRSFNSRCRLLS